MGAKSALMTDGYAVYDQIAQAHQLVHLACWAHCRRDFNDALQALPKNARTVDQLAAQFMALIAQLYAVEAKARERELGVQELLEQRQLHSVPVLQKIEALLLASIHVVLPGSLLGKALHYLSAQWSKLKLYVTAGEYPIDNNACENSIRPFVIGRNNANCSFMRTHLRHRAIPPSVEAPTASRLLRMITATAGTASTPWVGGSESA